MYFLIFLLLLAKVALSKAAVHNGRPHVDRELQERDQWNPSNSTLTCLFLTSEPGWAGEMQNLCQIAGVCDAQLPDGLKGTVSSAGPTAGQTCFLYSDVDCTGTRSAPIVYPGYASLSAIGFDKTAVSWRCWKMCGYEIGTASSASVSTVEPTIGPASSISTTAAPPSSSNSTTASITFTNSFSSSPVEARQVDATSNRPPITTTLTGSQPAVTISTMEQTSVPTTTANVISSTFSSVGTSSIPASPTTFSLASSTSSSTTSVNTNTPGFSMSPSPVTLTHTFADGSTTVITTSVIEPVPTVPSEPPML